MFFKVRHIIAAFVSVCAFYSCGGNGNPVAFKCEMRGVSDIPVSGKLTLTEVAGEGFNTKSVIIRDSIAISMEQRDGYLFSISNVTTGELLGQFCRQGKSSQEILSAIPIKAYMADAER